MLIFVRLEAGVGLLEGKQMLRGWLCPIVYLKDQDRAGQESSEIICPQRRKINMSDGQAKLFVRFLG